MGIVSFVGGYPFLYPFRPAVPTLLETRRIPGVGWRPDGGMAVRPTERVERAIAYLMDGGTDPAVLADMGLSTRELDDVVTLVPWGNGVSAELRDAIERLCDSRARAEAEAGLRMSVIVVPADRPRRPSPGAVALVIAALAGTIFAVVVGAGAGRPDPESEVAKPARPSRPATKPSRTPPPARSRSRAAV